MENIILDVVLKSLGFYINEKERLLLWNIYITISHEDIVDHVWEDI